MNQPTPEFKLPDVSPYQKRWRDNEELHTTVLSTSGMPLSKKAKTEPEGPPYEWTESQIKPNDNTPFDTAPEQPVFWEYDSAISDGLISPFYSTNKSPTPDLIESTSTNPSTKPSPMISVATNPGPLDQTTTKGIYDPLSPWLGPA